MIQNASQRVEEHYHCMIYFPYSRFHVFQGFSDFLSAPVEICVKKSFHVEFSLQGIPVMNYFVARDAEMTQLTQNLLPTTVGLMRRKVFILHGLGGIGKTQLSVEFARQYHKNYTAVFWVDGSTKERLRRSIADLAGRLPQHQISENSRNYSQEKSMKNNADVNEIVKDVLNWLSQSSNDQWLLIFDNLDREFSVSIEDPKAFNVQDFFPTADQGSILITSRLASLYHLGTDMKVKPVNQLQGESILEKCLGQSMQGQCNKKHTCSGII